MNIPMLLTRRSFLRLAGLAGLGALLGACGPKATAVPTVDPSLPTPLPGEFTGAIQMHAGAYIPNSARQDKGAGAPAREALAQMADEWREGHPHIRIEFIEAPSMLPFETWINSQLLIGEGPDIFRASLGYLNGQAGRELVVPLNDYLRQPNPHTPLSAYTWGAQFLEPFSAAVGAAGALGGVPVDRTATGIYANRALLERAGVDLSAGAPARWAELLAWCQAVKAPGVMPFSMTTTVLDNWLQAVLADQLLHGLTERFDMLNYHDDQPPEAQQGVISQEEILMQTACYGWQPFGEPAVRALYELVKDFTAYLPVGYQNGSIMSASWEYFLQGQLAMLWDGCWRARTIAADEQKGFGWFSFWLPPVTRESTLFAAEVPIQPRDVGGFDSALGINGAVVQRGNLDACIDWLMYISTPENNARIVNEVASLLPAARSAEVNPELAGLFGGKLAGAGIEQHPWPAPVWWFGLSTGKFSDTFQREMSIYLLEEGTLDGFMTACNEAAQLEISDLVVRNALQYNPDGRWDLTRWPCEPPVQGM